MGQMNLYNGVNYTFTSDRFCSPRSAVFLHSGYLQAPSGVYFTDDFTITAWVYANSYAYTQRIIDFGNGQATNNVVLSFRSHSSSLIFLAFDGIRSRGPITPPAIKYLKQWYFVSAVFSYNLAIGSTFRIYVNGKLFYNATDSIKTNRINIVRNSNFIGKTNWIGNGFAFADSIYDDIAIYQNALSDTDIMNLYDEQSSSGGKIYVFINR